MLSKWPLFAAAFGLLTCVLFSQANSKQISGIAQERARANQLQVAPSLNEELAKFRRVPMPFHSQGLSAREQDLVKKLVEASQYLEQIYWRQSDPDGLKLLISLEASKAPQDAALRRFLMINGSRYDLIRNNAPFVGTTPMSPDHGLYPAGLTREEMEAYVRAHPEQKAALYAPQTVVRRDGDRLVAVPYHVAYRQWLEPAAQALNEAAALSDDQKFANFLRLRAKALLDDDFYASDIAWIELENPKFDVIFAPYEVYLDDLLGVKTSYGAAVMIRNEEESQETGALPEVRSGDRRLASYRGAGSALQGRPSFADGSYGHAVSRGRPAARLSGRGG